VEARLTQKYSTTSDKSLTINTTNKVYMKTINVAILEDHPDVSKNAFFDRKQILNVLYKKTNAHETN